MLLKNILVRTIWDQVHADLCQMVLRDRNNWFIKWEI